MPASARAQDGGAPPPNAPRLEARGPDGPSSSLRLLEESHTVEIDGQWARTTLHQVFANESDQTLEGRFSLRTDEGTSVSGFSYWNGKERIRGEVFEKQDAEAVYNEVTGQGRDPGLLTDAGEGAFSFRVFPIAPREHKRIEVTYEGWMARVGQEVTYRLPMASDRGRVTLRMRGQVRGLSSPTHDISVSVGKDGTTSVRSGGRKDRSSAFVLRYAIDESPWKLRADVHKDAGHDGYLHLALAVPPGEKATVRPKDVTVVLDRSGSMAGEPLAQAKQAIRQILGHLRKGDRFNLVSFDDGAEVSYAEPQMATRTLREEVGIHLDRVQSGGGTNIAGALRKAMDAQAKERRLRFILLITDGQSDAQAALAEARNNHADARIYTIGLGHGVDRALLSRIADESRGTFTFIPYVEAITDRIRDLSKQLSDPIVTDLSLHAEGVTLRRIYPTKLPDLFAAQELRVGARFSGDGPFTVVLRGMRDGEQVSFRAPVVAGPRRRGWVGRSWADSRIDSLLSEIALSGETKEWKDEVITLGVTYNLTSPYTAFLAIPENEVTDGAADTLASARARKEALLKANPDAVALSRSAMPPGDPVLRVRAPRDARRVVAHFPFGLVRELHYNPAIEQWETRFLVPNDQGDGDYEVEILIVDRFGSEQLGTAPYTIDSEGPDFEAHIEGSDEGMRLCVTTLEEARRVTAVSLTDPNLRLDPEPMADGRYCTELPKGAEIHTFRVVVADMARNEGSALVTTTGMQPDVDGGDHE
ncbi:MAG: VWA domain-containing protein [Myxococcales bacterium]|nr:VWA domain-containing protein [Myxococcales bacterium]